MTDTWKNLEGQKDEIVGKVKEVFGKATNDAELQAKGVAQQVEGEIKEAIASGRGHVDEIRENYKERAESAVEDVKRHVEETRESVHTAADEKLKEAIDEGKRLKEEAALKAEELRKEAVRDGEEKREEAREKSTKAYEEAENLTGRVNQTIDETVESIQNNEKN
ncbi:CsbD family protein [Aerococcaceae bacterium WGS1372]